MHSDLAEEWNKCIGLLSKNLITLNENLLDFLCWSKNPKNGSFTARLGNKFWFEGKKMVVGIDLENQSPVGFKQQTSYLG
jgi:hypothetical protein